MEECIGQRIKKLRKELKMTQTDLALECNTTKQTIHKYESSIVTNIPLDRVEMLAEALHTTPDYLTGWADDPIDYDSFDIPKRFLEAANWDVEKAYHMWIAVEENQAQEAANLNSLRDSVTKGIKIPVLGDVAAGVPIDAITDIIDYEEISEEMAKTGEFFGLRIKGDSMSPRIMEGDIVIVQKTSTVNSGELAVVLVNSEAATVKKYIRHDNGISLISFNSSYEPMFFTASEIESLPVSIIGKVVESRAKF